MPELAELVRRAHADHGLRGVEIEGPTKHRTAHQRPSFGGAEPSPRRIERVTEGRAGRAFEERRQTREQLARTERLQARSRELERERDPVERARQAIERVGFGVVRREAGTEREEPRGVARSVGAHGGERTELERRLVGDAEALARGHEGPRVRRGREERDEERTELARDRVHLVEDQQDVRARFEGPRELVDPRRRGSLGGCFGGRRRVELDPARADVEREGEPRSERVGALHLREVDPERVARTPVARTEGELPRETGLADPRRSEQHEQAGSRREELLGARELGVAADERPERSGRDGRHGRARSMRRARGRRRLVLRAIDTAHRLT